ncbi:hypothetical protein [Aurantiacibacter sediminis]|uniref:Amidase n=1 Tax=Aurantiacibacter sediminis TaxID=2793064 RepID=A0ABS0N222_9SPHN|nr:hypothetical protein [Aurantiacibacter sediminis]MBH5321355.1 hypothetical protein [Aurantiacibacter sediminis]
MATGKQAKTSLFSILLRATGFMVVAVFLITFFFGEAIAGFSDVGTSYAAKHGCGCVYIAGRDIDSCYADLTPEMWPIWLSEDADAQSVSASIPLIASEEASYREGYGCVLEAYSR